MGLFSSKVDPLAAYCKGQLTGRKFQQKLERLTPCDMAAVNQDEWCAYIKKINEQLRGHSVHLAFMRVMIEKMDREDLLIDIAVNARGDDTICGCAISRMKEQASLQRVMERFNESSPFHVYYYIEDEVWYGNSSQTPNYRGGFVMWTLLRRIDDVHFVKAMKNCSGSPAWMDQLRGNYVKGWFFHNGLKALRYKELLPLAEQRLKNYFREELQ